METEQNKTSNPCRFCPKWLSPCSRRCLITAVVVFSTAGALFIFSPQMEKNGKAIVDVLHEQKPVTFTVNGEPVTLVAGVSEKESAPGSASKIITRYFGNEVTADLDGDGTKDIAFLVTQETGGSGTFFYLTALLNTKNGPVGTDSVFLGDRISPQSTSVDKNNIIVVNYAERNPGESFSVQPSLGKSIWLKLDPKTMQFGEVAQNFEGEADPSRMKLNMKTWNWVKTTYSGGEEVKPSAENKFTVTFKDDKTFSATTDCNGVGGGYETSGSSITFGQMASTLMYCEGSQEGIFTSTLADTQSYNFTSKGELILNLKSRPGTMIFR